MHGVWCAASARITRRDSNEARARSSAVDGRCGWFNVPARLDASFRRRRGRWRQRRRHAAGERVARTARSSERGRTEHRDADGHHGDVDRVRQGTAAFQHDDFAAVLRLPTQGHRSSRARGVRHRGACSFGRSSSSAPSPRSRSIWRGFVRPDARLRVSTPTSASCRTRAPCSAECRSRRRARRSRGLGGRPAGASRRRAFRAGLPPTRQSSAWCRG